MNRKEVGEKLYRQKIDHVIPLAAGGKHSWDNVKVCCGMCNILKSDKVVGV